LPDGQNGFARLQAERFDSLHAGIYRFDKTGLLKGDAVGDFHGSLVDDPIHDPDVFGESAAGRLETRCASDFFVRGALGEGLVAAVVALAAGDVVENYDPIAGSKAGDAGTCGCDYPGGFMAENAWGGMRSGSNFLEVGAADATGVNPYQQLSGTNLRDGDSFEADVIYTSVNRRQHSGGDGLRLVVDCELSGNGHRYSLDEIRVRFASTAVYVSRRLFLSAFGGPWVSVG
jgi:hypothetical protein